MMNKKGFTFIEAVIATCILSIATVVSSVVFLRYKWDRELIQSSQQVALLLRRAQHEALTGNQLKPATVACGYGVYVESVDKPILFLNGYDAGSVTKSCEDASPPIQQRYVSSRSIVVSSAALENSEVVTGGGRFREAYFELPFGGITINNQADPLSNTGRFQVEVQHTKTSNLRYVCIFGTGNIIDQEMPCL